MKKIFINEMENFEKCKLDGNKWIKKENIILSMWLVYIFWNNNLRSMCESLVCKREKKKKKIAW